MTAPKIVGELDLSNLSHAAASLPRRRKNLNLHPVLEDPVQRLFNAMAPGTYVRPHRHDRPNGWEIMLAVRGAFSILIFDDAGAVLERIDLGAAHGATAVEIPARAWHTVVVMDPDTVMFEVKPGPYSPLGDKDFAAWAPLEGEAGTERFVAWYEAAVPGEKPPSLPGAETG